MTLTTKAGLPTTPTGLALVTDGMDGLWMESDAGQRFIDAILDIERQAATLALADAARAVKGLRGHSCSAGFLPHTEPGHSIVDRAAVLAILRESEAKP